MAYISKEQVKEIRENLKKEFPNIKFSVTRNNYSKIEVAIIKSNLDFGTNFLDINHYYLEKYPHADILKRIKEIANEGNFDKSDIQSDYFHVGWYFSLLVGKWDKDYEMVA